MENGYLLTLLVARIIRLCKGEFDALMSARNVSFLAPDSLYSIRSIVCQGTNFLIAAIHWSLRPIGTMITLRP